MYMSYCRYEGTRKELKACFYDAIEHMTGEAEYAVSDREIKHFRSMVEEMITWLRDDMDLLDEEGELDTDALDRICEALAQAAPEGDEDEDDD